MSLGKFIKGVTFGTLAGGALGLLFAPTSGNQLRKKLTKEVDEATDLTLDLNDSLKNFQQAVSEVRATAKEILPVFNQDTKKMVADFKFQAEPRIKEIKIQVEKLQKD